MKIPCQHPKNQKGCIHCGGRGWIIQSSKTTCCGRKIWTDGWPLTVYVGKTYSTFNGVKMIVTKTGIECVECVK